jgi:hypothetical protein
MRFDTGATGVGDPLAGARTGQAWVGAATDAEAARNLQARAQQDQATQMEVARLNSATSALRDLREARSPKASFGVDSIGGGPDKLDVASGRVVNRDTPANVVADRMMGAVDTARRFGAGGKAGRLAAKQIGEAYLADKGLQGEEMKAGAENARGAAQFASNWANQQAQLGLQERQLQRSLANDEYTQSKDAYQQKYAEQKDLRELGQKVAKETQGLNVLEATKGAVQPAAIQSFARRMVGSGGLDGKQLAQLNQAIPGVVDRINNNSLTDNDYLQLDAWRKAYEGTGGWFSDPNAGEGFQRYFGANAP